MQFTPLHPLALRSVLMLSFYLCLHFLASGFIQLSNFAGELQSCQPYSCPANITPLETKYAGSSINSLNSDWLRAGRSRDRSLSLGMVKYFHYYIPSRPVLGYPMGTGALSPGVKQQGREADHSPPTSVEVKQTWIYTSTPPIRLHGCRLSAKSE
jgi:hypothetical protein